MFLVAEIGVNWDGNLELAREMMAESKKAGCNAVKFQAFEENTVKDHPERLRLMKTSISKSNIEEINKLARSIDIEWFCTPMYTGAVDLLDSYVNRFKIRERDGQPLLKNQTSDLIERILKTGKEVIVSSATTPKNSKFFGKPNIRWLYCVPKYPCTLEDLDFSNLKDFNGYSNHCPQIIAPLSSAILGAEIIEIHLTSNKSLNFFDNNVSFDYNELKQLVALVHASEKIKKK